MNKYNHFLTSSNLLLALFKSSGSLIEIVFFAYFFGTLIDANQKIGEHLNKPLHHRRTWLEEPLGFILVGLPTALILSIIKNIYFFMTLIPYGSHVLLDYLTLHEVSPLAPFSKKNIRTGLFKAYPAASWYTGQEKGPSENYFLIFNLFITALIIWHFHLF